MDSTGEIGFVPGQGSGFTHLPQQGQQTGSTGLVVQEPGLDKAAPGDNRLGIIADIVAGGNAQSQDVLLVVYLLIDAHCHILFVPGTGGGVVLHMNRRRQAEHSTGIYLAFPGVDAAVFAVQGGQQRAADLGDHQHAVCGDRTHHQTQGIHMGAEPHLVSALPTGHCDDQIALVGTMGVKSQFPGDLLCHSHDPFSKAGGAVLSQQLLQCIHQKGLTGLSLHLFLCHI